MPYKSPRAVLSAQTQEPKSVFPVATEDAFASRATRRSFCEHHTIVGTHLCWPSREACVTAPSKYPPEEVPSRLAALAASVQLTKPTTVTEWIRSGTYANVFAVRSCFLRSSKKCPVVVGSFLRGTESVARIKIPVCGANPGNAPMMRWHIEVS